MASEMLDEKAIFNVARQIGSPNARAEYLQQACGTDSGLRERVQVLLRAYEEQASFLESPPPVGGIPTIDQPASESPGAVIGPYKLIEPIGEGGMGTVWMAQQQEPVKRLVALKLIKAGMDSRQVIARFEAERQALALMDHANIARVLDAGTTSAGRPYFVMDLVKGMPITGYCDEHHLTPRQRLELFVPVCSAVQHAHQKGIIHRDLKPSNVLVALYDGKPVPKVIDFGVAKATGQTLTDKTLVTGYGAIVGTLEYMSPEQAEINQLDIDTRSDVYALGVLLYELLTGSPPFTKKELQKPGMLEMLRVIREQEPSKPSTKLCTAEGLPTLAANRGTEPARLTKLVRGELDWIVMKALEKDRSRRYETANALVADVQRYLNDEQVLACPPSVGYRLRKFVRRNKNVLATLALLGMVLLVAVGVAGMPATVVVAVVVAILTAGLVLLADSNRRARQQRERAENNLGQAQAAEKRAKGAAAQAEAITHFLIDDLLAEAAPEKHAYGNQITVEELLNRAARNIDRAFPGQPDIEAAVRLTVGRTYHSLGQLDLAEPHLYRAVELRRAFLGPEHAETLEALNALAVVLEMRGKLAEAEPLFRQASSGCREVLGQDHPLTLSALHNLAWSLHDRGNAAEAEPLYRQCLEIRRRVLGFEHPDTLTSLHHLAWLLWDQDKPGEAGPMLRETLTARRRVLPSGHPDISKTLTLLGWVLTDTGKAPEAEPLLREALAVRRKALPAGHWLTAITANILGGCLTAQGSYAEAEPLLLESCGTLEGCETHQTASGFPPGRIPEVLGRLVELYHACGRQEVAATWREKREAAGRLTGRPGRACGPRRVDRMVPCRHDTLEWERLWPRTHGASEDSSAVMIKLLDAPDELRSRTIEEAMSHAARANPPAVVGVLRDESEALGFRLASDPLTGSLLRTLAATKPAGTLLELGTGTGLGTAWLLDGMSPDTRLVSVDVDPSVIAIARRYLAGDPRVAFHTEDAAALLPRLPEAGFDLVFADAWAGKYTHLREALRLLKPGGLYVVDDMLPQTGWPDDQRERAERLIAELERREDLTLTKVAWSTGIIIAVKRR